MSSTQTGAKRNDSGFLGTSLRTAALEKTVNTNTKIAAMNGATNGAIRYALQSLSVVGISWTLGSSLNGDVPGGECGFASFMSFRTRTSWGRGCRL